MVKILHAADFHLDSAFASLDGEKAALRRREQRDGLMNIAALAREADIVLLSGDLFDCGRAYGETVDALTDFFAAISAPVFIAPGNHDYYAPQSPYAHIEFPGNVHVFTDGEPSCVLLPELGCAVWGAAFTAGRKAPQLRSFQVSDRSIINIMTLHAEADAADSRYGAVSTGDIERSGLDYLALGHVHSFSGMRRAGNTAWAYPGCTMGRGFDETGEKGVIFAQVSKDGCELRFVPVPGRRYAELEADVTAAADLAAAVLAAAPENSRENIYRITLRGELRERPDTAQLQSRLSDSFWHVEVRDETRLSRDIWDAVGEDTLKGNFLRILRARYDKADEQEKKKIVMAVRFGLAALEYREDM